MKRISSEAARLHRGGRFRFISGLTQLAGTRASLRTTYSMQGNVIPSRQLDVSLNIIDRDRLTHIGLSSPQRKLLRSRHLRYGKHDREGRNKCCMNALVVPKGPSTLAYSRNNQIAIRDHSRCYQCYSKNMQPSQWDDNLPSPIRHPASGTITMRKREHFPYLQCAGRASWASKTGGCEIQ